MRKELQNDPQADVTPPKALVMEVPGVADALSNDPVSLFRGLLSDDGLSRRCRTLWLDDRLSLNQKSMLVRAGFTPPKLPSSRLFVDVRPDLIPLCLSDRNPEGLFETAPASSALRVWWRCPVCGHEWRAGIANVASSRRHALCRGCIKDLRLADKLTKGVRCVETGALYASRGDAARWLLGVAGIPDDRDKRKSRSFGISRAIKTGGTAYGFHWQEVPEDDPVLTPEFMEAVAVCARMREAMLGPDLSSPRLRLGSGLRP